jgi:hypothetical protein
MGENDSYMAQDFGMMNFSGKIVDSSCSWEDLDRINQHIEQKKLQTLVSRLKKFIAAWLTC